ncbi:HAD hydrolase-like protein [Arthrobacter sp. UYCu511]|uniref:HAD hydrolase-like protein n=1 Tax=Arthrobacter sp. UYCu511 TaxID=3156337 RepID=UPI0033961B13
MSTVTPAINTVIQRQRLPSVVLFDLDGTLVDPAGGITGGLEYALAAKGLPVPGPDVLKSMIGPKLADGLINFLGVPHEHVDEVIAVYRGWYMEHGMAMSVVYAGIENLLVQLKDAGVYLAVATQKPEPLAKELLALHGLDTYFHIIRGSHSDENLRPGDPDYRAGKAEIIAAALADSAAFAALDAIPGTDLNTRADLHTGAVVDAIMVGDRHQDVHGASSNGINCIGVAWGFAAEGELEAAGVAAVVHSAEELAAQLSGTNAAKEAGHGAV